MRLGTWIGIGLFALAGVGCGGGGGNKPGSYNDISASFAHPTGTLAATNADAVAMAYASSKSSAGSSPVAGRRLDSTSSAAAVTQACPAGGNISIDVGQATAAAVSESWTYNNCCETAGCCLNGGGNIYYAATGTAAGSYCESYQITGTCSSLPVAENFSTCTNGSTGEVSYLIQVGGQTFVVSGSYSNGTGTLTITDKTGTYSCTYSGDHGTCSAGVGTTFTF